MGKKLGVDATLKSAVGPAQGFFITGNTGREPGSGRGSSLDDRPARAQAVEEG
jgi:hypothetical protein